jgi:hypothetical protein
MENPLEGKRRVKKKGTRKESFTWPDSGHRNELIPDPSEDPGPPVDNL